MVAEVKSLNAISTDHPLSTSPKAAGMNQAMYYAIGILMMKGISLIMMPYVTRQLSPEQYGLLESLLVVADIGTIIIGFGLVEALYRYVGEQHDKNQRVVAACLTLAAAMTLVAFILLWIAQASVLALLPPGLQAHQLWLIAIPTFAEGFIAIPLTLMRMQSLAKQFCMVNVFKALFQALMVVWLLEQGYGIDAILLAGAIASIVMVLLLLRFQYSALSGCGGMACIDKDTLLNIGRYGVPIVASRIGLFAITGLDRWLLADQVGVEQLAVYAIAMKFALILGLLMQPFGLWWFPKRIGLSQQPGGLQQCAYYALLGTNCGVFLAAAMVMTLPLLLTLVLPEQYHAAAGIVVWLAAINAIKNAGDLLNLGCFTGESTQVQMWVQWLCAGLALAGYGLLIPEYGVSGALWVLLLVYGLRLLLFYIFSQRCLPLPYPHKKWMTCLLLSMLFIGTNQLGQWLLTTFGDSPLVVLQCVLALILTSLLLVTLFMVRVFPLSWLRKAF